MCSDHNRCSLNHHLRMEAQLDADFLHSWAAYASWGPELNCLGNGGEADAASRGPPAHSIFFLELVLVSLLWHSVNVSDKGNGRHFTERKKSDTQEHESGMASPSAGKGCGGPKIDTILGISTLQVLFKDVSFLLLSRQTITITRIITGITPATFQLSTHCALV